ncbi:hypothetical protein BXU11_16580 [Flavobacterium sp. LM5]|nr:hypothetical protein BXU11_16580 [Flavobacterium sp. LM5]
MLLFQTSRAPTQTLSTLDIAITPANVTCQGAGNGKVSFTLSDFNVATSHVKYKVFNSQTNVEYLPAIAGMVTKASAIAGFDIPDSLIPGTYYILFTEYDNVGAVDLCINSSKTFTITQSVVPLTLTANSDKNDNCELTKV